MRPAQIKTHIESELSCVLKEVENAGLASLYICVDNALRKLNAPLRLAIVGRTKAGKSTLMNGLLGVSFLPTGTEVTTYNVNVLHHINRSPLHKEHVLAHLKDGSEIVVSLQELEDLVDNRKPDPNQLRKRIAWADVFIDNPHLLNMDIIDTPGEDDASHSIEITEKIQNFFNDAEQRPDVIAYVIRCEVTNKDLEDSFEYLQSINSGEHSVSALNVVVVYNGTDQLLGEGSVNIDWTVDYRHMGLEIIEKCRSRSPQFRKSFSKAFSTAAVYAHAAHALTEHDYEIMRQIANTDISDRFALRFTLDNYKKIERFPELQEILPDKAERESLANRLGLYAMRYMVWWLKNNPLATIEELRRALNTYSNVPTLRSYIFNEHFQKLSIFYKASGVIPTLIKEIKNVYNSTFDTSLKNDIDEIIRKCTYIKNTLYGNFGFLSVLNDYYNQKEYFDEDEWAKVVDTIAKCLDDDIDTVEIKKVLCYWKSQNDYYNRIYNISAAEATEKLIKSLHNL